CTRRLISLAKSVMISRVALVVSLVIGGRTVFDRNHIQKIFRVSSDFCSKIGTDVRVRIFWVETARCGENAQSTAATQLLGRTLLRIGSDDNREITRAN